MQGADEGVPLVEPQEHVHAPLQLRVPHVEGRHINQACDESGKLPVVLAIGREFGVEKHD